MESAATLRRADVSSFMAEAEDDGAGSRIVPPPSCGPSSALARGDDPSNERAPLLRDALHPSASDGNGAQHANGGTAVCLGVRDEEGGSSAIEPGETSDGADRGGRSVGGRLSAMSATAAVALTTTVVLAALAVPWNGMERALEDFPALGAAGHKLGRGEARHGGGRRTGSETAVPKAPSALDAFNPFTDPRGLKLDPRKLPPLTPAGLAKSQKGTMLVDQVSSMWLQSSADAEREEADARRRRRRRGGAYDADSAERGGKDDADRLGWDDEDARRGERRRGTAGGGFKTSGAKRKGATGKARAEDGGDDVLKRSRASKTSTSVEEGDSNREEELVRKGKGKGKSAVNVFTAKDDEDRSRRPKGGDGGHGRRRRRGGKMFDEPMLGDAEPDPPMWGQGGRGGGGQRGVGFPRAATDDDDFSRDDYGDRRLKKPSFVARGRGDARRGRGGDAASAAASFDARERIRREVIQSGRRSSHGGGGSGVGWMNDYYDGPTRLGDGEDESPRRRDETFEGYDEIDPVNDRGGGGGGRAATRGPQPCILKRTATAKQAQAVLDYACNPVHGMSCSPISNGGKYYLPNTKQDHAAWAIHQFFKRRSAEPDAFPQQDCHFVGVATLDVPGNFYLTAAGALVRANHHTDVITRKVRVPAEGMYFNTKEEIVGELTGRADDFDALRANAAPATSFKFWMGAAPGAPAGCLVETTVVYDFDGDGRPERTESFEPQGVPEEPNLIPVETKVLGHSIRARGDKFWPAVTHAKVQLFVKSPNCPGEVNVWESAAMYPSFITIPYRAPIGN